MALEQTEIVNELKTQGINESLGNGLSFETTEDLSSWVNAYKTSLPPKGKEIQDYTKEEIEAIAKDPQFKGAKGLQGYFDSLRQKAPVVPKPDDKNPQDFAALIAEMQKPLLEKLEALTNQKKAESFDSQVRDISKQLGISDEELISDIKEGLKEDSTAEEIKAKIEKKKAWLSKLGIKQFGTPGGGGGDNTGDLKNAMAEWNKKQDSRKK